MWYLKGPKGELYYLCPGREHVVGRKDSDLVFADDQSISRKHAVITVNHHPSGNLDDPSKLPEVSITETGSKYGTVINTKGGAVTMPKNSTRVLNDGDSIHFGRQWNIWSLVYEPMVVIMSTLTGVQKKEVKDIVGRLGGHIVSSWRDDCTHLTMSSFTMTVKAIIALALGKAIVVPEFWKKYLLAINNKSDLPKYEDFLPPLAETIINKNEVSFLIKPERRELFKGKEFLFFTSQQHGEHACLVTAAGGTASILDLDVTPKKKLADPHIIVMQHLSNPSCQVSQAPQLFPEVISFLQSHGKRVIPVSEIGLAILHCSTEKYCNPSFSFASTMLSSNRNTASHFLSQQTLASETQETESNRRSKRQNAKEKVIIPDSGTISKQPAIPCNKEESQPTLLEGSLHLTEKQSEPMSSSSSSSTRSASQKRPRSKESEDAVIHQPSKKLASGWPKDSKRTLKSKLDDDEDDAEGLFDFTTDKMKDRSREDDDEDIFAFKEPVSVKVEATAPVEDDEDGKEDLFSFQTTLSFSSGVTQPTTSVKRKLSDDADGPCKRKALEGNSLDSKVGFENESLYESQGFLSASDVKREKSAENESINDSCNSTIVVVKPLVTSQPVANRTAVAEGSLGRNVKNFKKFRKIQATNVSILPRIIGGQDLVPYSNTSSAVIRNLFDNNDGDLDEEQDVQDDWAFQTVGNTKRKGQSRRL